MKTFRFTDSQIIAILKQAKADAGPYIPAQKNRLIRGYITTALTGKD